MQLQDFGVSLFYSFKKIYILILTRYYWHTTGQSAAPIVINLFLAYHFKSFANRTNSGGTMTLSLRVKIQGYFSPVELTVRR